MTSGGGVAGDEFAGDVGGRIEGAGRGGAVAVQLAHQLVVRVVPVGRGAARRRGVRTPLGSVPRDRTQREADAGGGDVLADGEGAWPADDTGVAVGRGDDDEDGSGDPAGLADRLSWRRLGRSQIHPDAVGATDVE